MPEPLVKFIDIRKEYDQTIAVAGVNLEINQGEFVVLLGPSGSGKTTILSMLGGFVVPTSGQVLIEGQNITHLTPAKRPTATVFQDYALFPHMTVANNIGFGLTMHKIRGAERARRVQETLNLVGLKGFGKRHIHQMSGGQRQRIALARAIAVQPTVLLLDEPLGALDLKLRRQMQYELVRIQKEIGTTFIHVTHDQEEAMSIADKIVVLNNGLIEDMGPPREVYLHPKTLFTANFMGESNLFVGELKGASDGKAVIGTPFGEWHLDVEVSAQNKLSVVFRPEQLAIRPLQEATSLSLGRAKVAKVLFQGSYLRVEATSETPDIGTLLLTLAADNRLVEGEIIDVYANAADAVVVNH
jgi:spermidine/putrescine transport system ATP-binding protein